MKKRKVSLPSPKQNKNAVLMIRVPHLLKEQIAIMCERLECTQTTFFIKALAGYLYDVEQELKKNSPK